MMDLMDKMFLELSQYHPDKIFRPLPFDLLHKSGQRILKSSTITFKNLIHSYIVHQILYLCVVWKQSIKMENVQNLFCLLSNLLKALF